MSLEESFIQFQQAVLTSKKWKTWIQLSMVDHVVLRIEQIEERIGFVQSLTDQMHFLNSNNRRL